MARTAKLEDRRADDIYETSPDQLDTSIRIIKDAILKLLQNRLGISIEISFHPQSVKIKPEAVDKKAIKDIDTIEALIKSEIRRIFGKQPILIKIDHGGITVKENMNPENPDFPTDRCFLRSDIKIDERRRVAIGQKSCLRQDRYIFRYQKVCPKTGKIFVILSNDHSLPLHEAGYEIEANHVADVQRRILLSGKSFQGCEQNRITLHARGNYVAIYDNDKGKSIFADAEDYKDAFALLK